MGKYRLNKPIRIANLNDEEYLLAIPRAQIKIRINNNVLEFIKFLDGFDIFDESIVESYLLNNNITNKEDHINMFSLFIKENLIIKINERS